MWFYYVIVQIIPFQLFADSFRNTIYFCIFMFCPMTSLCLLFSTFYFLDSFGFSTVTIISSTNEEFYYFLFSILYAFNLSSFSTALDMTFRAMLNKSSESRYPCLVPDLRENFFSFLRWCMTLAFFNSYYWKVLVFCFLKPFHYE